MVDTVTPNLNLIKPEIGASADSWGNKLNANFDVLDQKVLRQTIQWTVTAGDDNPASTAGHWVLSRYNNAGVKIDEPIVVNRQNGAVVISGPFGALSTLGVSGAAGFSSTVNIVGLLTAGAISAASLATSAGINTTGGIAVGGGVTVGANLAVAGNISGNLLTVNGATVNGNIFATGALTINNNASIGGTLTTTGLGTFQGSLDVAGSIGVGNNVTINGVAAVVGSLSAGSLSTTGTLSVNGTSTMAAINSSGNISTSAGVSAVNVFASNDVSATNIISGASGNFNNLSLTANATIGGFINVAGNISGNLLTVNGATVNGSVVVSNTVGTQHFNATGNVTINTGGNFLGQTFSSSVKLEGVQPIISFNNQSIGIGVNFGMNNDQNFYYGGWSLGASLYKFWTTRETAWPVSNIRLQFAGDQLGTVSAIPVEPFSGAVISGISVASTPVNQISSRWRYLQAFTNNWFTISYV